MTRTLQLAAISTFVFGLGIMVAFGLVSATLAGDVPPPPVCCDRHDCPEGCMGPGHRGEWNPLLEDCIAVNQNNPCWTDLYGCACP